MYDGVENLSELVGKSVVNSAFARGWLIASKTRNGPMVVAKPNPSTTIYQHLRHISQAKPIGHEPFLMPTFHLLAARNGKQRLASRLTIGEPKVALSVKINSVYDDIIVIQFYALIHSGQQRTIIAIVKGLKTPVLKLVQARSTTYKHVVRVQWVYGQTVYIVECDARSGVQTVLIEGPRTI